MKNFFSLALSKRQKFVIIVFFLSVGLFVSEFFNVSRVVIGGILAFFTDLLLYISIRHDVKGKFYYPIFILPFLYTLAFSLIYLLFPPRFLSKILLTSLYAFGLYSLFLTQNIFLVSTVRTITLLRSARIVSFVIMIIVLFFLINIVFSMRLPIWTTPIIVFGITTILNFQSFWLYTLDERDMKEIILFSIFNAFSISQLAFIISLWPVNATIYSISLTGIFYSFSGLSHHWLERRLFKGILWEYIWVGVVSIVILIFYTRWGI